MSTPSEPQQERCTCGIPTVRAADGRILAACALRESGKHEQPESDLRMALCGPEQPLDREPHLFCPTNPPNAFQRRMGSYCCTGLSHRKGEPRIICTHDCHAYKPPTIDGTPIKVGP